MRREDVDTSIWEDEDFDDLSDDAALIYLWSFTNSRCGMAGVYQVKARHICEGRLTPERREEALGELARGRFVYYVDGWLWVRTRVKHLRTKGEKIAISVIRDFNQLPPNHRIRKGFTEEYGSGVWISGWLKQALAEDPSRGPIDGSQGTGKGKGSSSSGVSRDAEWDEWLQHFRLVTGKEHTSGSAVARRAFNARRAEGRSLESLKQATLGCHGNEHLRKEGFNRPETILRESNIERYIALGGEEVAEAAVADDRSKYDRSTREVPA